MGDTILQFENISKSFFGIHALRDVTFSLERGQLLGLIGENGAGKTTLMNILGGVIQADEGTMRMKGVEYRPRNPAEAAKAGVAFIHQELNLFTNLSIADNIFIDRFPRIGALPLINKKAMRSRTRELLSGVELEVSPDTLVERISPGERQLVEIAKALGFGAEIMIFDEPTTSLTARETEQLFKIIEQLRAGGKSIIYISHNLGNVLHLADEIVVVRDGAVAGTGDKSEYTIDKMVSQMVGRDIDQMYPARTAGPSDTVALEVKDLSQSGIVKGISFSLRKGEVAGLFGLMGSGRSELARIIFGLDPFERGSVKVGGAERKRYTPAESIEKKIAFVTENRREEGLLMEAPIFDNIALVAMPDYTRGLMMRFVEKKRIFGAVGDVAESMRIKTASLDRQLAKNLSGGNQQKTVIGKWLLSKPAVFIMDEPTRGIDVGAKYEIYNIINDLAAAGTGILFISSELEELMGGCDRILVMSNGQIQGCFEKGDFDQAKILHAAFKGHKKHGVA